MGELLKKMCLCLLVIFSNAGYAQAPVLNIDPEGFDRKNTFIEFELNGRASSQGYTNLVNEKTGHSSALQRLNGNKYVCILPDNLKAVETGHYRLTKSGTPSKAWPVVVVLSGKTGELIVSVQHRKLFAYHTKVGSFPEKLDSVYARSGFIHPLLSPKGKVITDDYPVGHAHQHGIMMAWPNTVYKHTPVDFWNQQQKTGSVKHLKIENIERGPVITRIHLRLQHYSLRLGVVLDEKWTITVYPFTQHFLFDISSVQKNSTSDTLYLNRNIYGGMQFRGSRQWNDADSTHFRERWGIITDQGYDLDNADGKTASYVSAFGKVDGELCGVTVFCFPSNYRYPQPVRVHPVMPYWCFAPNAAGPMVIAPGGSYQSCYRYCVYDGLPDPIENERLNNDLKYPVRVSGSYR